ncbi:MAG: DUF6677 family protein [Candidatus Acidiferrales bacterium]
MGEAETPKIEAAKPQSVPAGREARGWMLGVLGWAIPGMGHLFLKKYDRAAVFFLSVATMGLLGLAMGAKLYAPPFDRSQGPFVLLLHVLGFVGDVGAGVLFIGAQLMGLGQAYMDRALGDYGTVFFLCAGLLNLLTALDAYDIAVGKKG